ncbi:hypothetical protein HMPREF0454_03510 [Hafnia alvei ATCC 51873]|uniref:Uncharacterized protein n=1 Tax=Hafnia alvei ATCC 51873 TaxID=1002364 RepID=G9YA90_HAFAL|nr:hypothetical protein HMPREF0454_03510 [Hafnia alvei ATCC 51873]
MLEPAWYIEREAANINDEYIKHLKELVDEIAIAIIGSDMLIVIGNTSYLYAIFCI